LAQAAGVYTDAAEILGIHRLTLARYVQLHPDLLEHVAQIEEAVDDMAEGNIKRALKAKDVGTSKWWVERRRRDRFSTRMEHAGPDGPIQVEHRLRQELRSMTDEDIALLKAKREEEIAAIDREIDAERARSAIAKGSED
jgi:hypothetical protein